MRTTGRSIGSAPCKRNASAIAGDNSTGRVITTRLPDNADVDGSATRAVNLLQNCTRAGLDQHLCQPLS